MKMQKKNQKAVMTVVICVLPVSFLLVTATVEHGFRGTQKLNNP